MAQNLKKIIDIKNDHVYITGAGSGLGKIIAKKLAKKGADITVTDIDLSSAEQTGIFAFWTI